MMHLKNITVQNPKTIEQYQLARQHKFLLWLFSEDGQEWHEAQEKFLPDTIKVVYVKTGEVVWVGKDTTSICPENKSVIELPDITANRRIDASGYWFYRDDKFVFDYKLKAEDERNALLEEISTRTSEWGKDLLLGLISDEDKEKLKIHRIYAKKLQAMDFLQVKDKSSYTEIDWPELPGFISGDEN